MRASVLPRDYLSQKSISLSLAISIYIPPRAQVPLVLAPQVLCCPTGERRCSGRHYCGLIAWQTSTLDLETVSSGFWKSSLKAAAATVRRYSQVRAAPAPAVVVETHLTTSRLKLSEPGYETLLRLVHDTSLHTHVDAPRMPPGVGASTAGASIAHVPHSLIHNRCAYFAGSLQDISEGLRAAVS